MIPEPNPAHTGDLQAVTAWAYLLTSGIPGTGKSAAYARYVLPALLDPAKTLTVIDPKGQDQ